MRAVHIGIRTTKYKEIVEWYQNILDFRVVKEWVVGTFQFTFLALPADNNFMLEIIGIGETNSNPVASFETGYHHICYQIDNLDKTMGVLKDLGINIDRSFSVPAIGKRAAFIKDPIGNVIEFFEDLK